MKRRGENLNPPDVYSGIESGPASAYSHLGKKPQIPTETIVKDLVDLLKAMPLSDAQVEALFLAISNRRPHRVCDKCKRLKPTVGGEWAIHPSLDLSMPRTFICWECK